MSKAIEVLSKWLAVNRGESTSRRKMLRRVGLGTTVAIAATAAITKFEEAEAACNYTSYCCPGGGGPSSSYCAWSSFYGHYVVYDIWYGKCYDYPQCGGSNQQVSCRVDYLHTPVQFC